MNITPDGHASNSDAPCKRFEKPLLAMALGMLPRESTQKIKQHMRLCSRCRLFYRLQGIIGDGMRSYFGACAVTTPEMIPTSLQLKLSRLRKDSIARWMYEIGRSLLFRHPEAVDTVYVDPGFEAVDGQLRRIENLCRSAKNDPLIGETGLKTGVIDRCIEAIDRIPPLFADNDRDVDAKEFLELSLKIDDSFMPAWKYLGNYHYLQKRFQPCYEAYKKGFELASNATSRWKYNILLSIAASGLGDFEKTREHIDEASAIHDDYQVDFHRFMNHLRKRDIPRASRSLDQLDNRLATTPAEAVDSSSYTIMMKFFVRNQDFLFHRFRNNYSALALVARYSEKGTR